MAQRYGLDVHCLPNNRFKHGEKIQQQNNKAMKFSETDKQYEFDNKKLTKIPNFLKISLKFPWASQTLLAPNWGQNNSPMVVTTLLLCITTR